MHESLWQITMDRWVLWFILGMSVLAIAIAIERLVVQWRFVERARALTETVTRCLATGALEEGRSACERSMSPLADVFLVGYAKLGRTKTENLHAAVHRARVRVSGQLKGLLWVVGTVGALAPFVGLFGTVVEVWVALTDIGQVAAEEGDVFRKTAPSIGAALIATAFGIAVALIAVALYNFHNQRLGKIALELRLLTEEFLEMLVEHQPIGNEDGSSKSTDKETDGGREAA